jgi:hypothetical protein
MYLELRLQSANVCEGKARANLAGREGNENKMNEEENDGECKTKTKKKDGNC